MNILLPDRKIKVFTVLYRNDEIQSYHQKDILEIIRLSEEFGYTGLLLFESNRGNIDPWFFAQLVLSNSRDLCPFIAVNPIYMHPFTVAKRILSLTKYYGRKIYINFISGTSISDMTSLGDNLDKEQRYERLKEYIQIIDALLRATRSLSFSGKFYMTYGLALSDRLPAELLPDYFIAGASIQAKELNNMFSSTSFSMANESYHQASPDRIKPLLKKGVHFGLITRPVQEEARKRSNELFKSNEDIEDMLSYSMTNTDSTWKKELFERSKTDSNNSFSLLPFMNLKADCPYYIGNYDQISSVIEDYVSSGVSTLVVEIPGGKEEFHHVEISLKNAEQQILTKYYWQP
jgi:alkanesulfonate monooxygenase